MLEDRVAVPVLSEELFCHRLLLFFVVSYTSDKPQRTTETDDKIGPHLRQEQQHDPLTPLTKLKEKQRPMTK
jgi:hypothetical protein